MASASTIRQRAHGGGPVGRMLSKPSGAEVGSANRAVGVQPTSIARIPHTKEWAPMRAYA